MESLPVSVEEKKQPCPDCLQCQCCSNDRCRICGKEGSCGRKPSLETGFTYGAYLTWKRQKSVRHRNHTVPANPGK